MPAPVGLAEVLLWLTVPPLVGVGLGSGELPVVGVVVDAGFESAAQPPTSAAAAAAAAIVKNRRRAVVTWSRESSMSTRRILPHVQLQHAANRDVTETESRDSPDRGGRAGRITGMSTGGGR